MRKWLSPVVALVTLCCAGPGPLAQAPGALPADTLVLSLDESVGLALKNNVELKVMEEKVQEARSHARAAGTSFLPQLTASAGYTRLDMAPYMPTSRFSLLLGGGQQPARSLPEKITIGLPDNYGTSLRLQQPIFTGGRLKNAYDMSWLAARGAESEVERTSAELVFEVKRAYLNCIKTQKYEQIAGETLKRLEAQLRDIEAMYEVGLAANNDVLKTKVYHSEAKLGLIKAQHGVRLSRKELCTLIDLPLESEIRFSTTVEEVTPPTIVLDAAIRTGLERRAELNSIGYQKMIARKDLEVARHGHLPDVFFFANLGYQYPNREYERDFYASWSMGVTAQMNVFDWGRVGYRAGESKSRLAQIELMERSARDRVTLDVTRTYLALLEAWDETEVAREGITQAGENYRVTNERFKEGLATNTDLLDAQMLLTNARLTHTGTVVDCLIAQADLARAMGGSAP